MTKIYEQKLSELTPDEHNANLGTERGRYMLDNSLRQYGAGRSILVDKNGKIIAGNKTTEAAADIDLDDVIVVETDGTKLVAVKRTDLDLDTDKNARLLAYSDNRSSEFLDWNPEIIEFDIGQGVDLSGMFQDWELGIEGEGNDIDELWQGMPEFEQEDLSPTKSLIINFLTLEDMIAFSKLIEQKITEKTKSIWYPKIERKKIKDMAFDEP